MRRDPGLLSGLDILVPIAATADDWKKLGCGLNWTDGSSVTHTYMKPTSTAADTPSAGQTTNTYTLTNDKYINGFGLKSAQTGTFTPGTLQYQMNAAQTAINKPVDDKIAAGTAQAACGKEVGATTTQFWGYSSDPALEVTSTATISSAPASTAPSYLSYDLTISPPVVNSIAVDCVTTPTECKALITGAGPATTKSFSYTLDNSNVTADSCACAATSAFTTF